MSMFGIVVKNVLTAILTFLVLASCFAWFYQHDLLHHPTRYTLEEMTNKYLESGLRIWPDSFNYRALVSEPKNTPIKGTIILFHGNAGSAVDRSWYSKDLTTLGYRVLIHEYTGYGARNGDLHEEAIIKDAIDTVTQSKSRYTGKTFLIGESLGAAVAARVAHQTTIDGLMLITPWDSLQNVAKDLYWYLPSAFLLREKYDSVENLKSGKMPMAMVIADKDTIINPSFSKNLYDSYSGSKKLWMATDATHNTWNKITSPDFWRDVFNFLESMPTN